MTKANLDSVPDDYQRKQTLANSERYITPELKEKESLIVGAEERAIQLEYDLFTDIRAKVGEAASDLLRLAEAIGELDVLLSLAHVAVVRRYCRPAITEDTVIDIKAGRHPVVEAMLPAGQFVPNDVYLDNETSQLIILTGLIWLAKVLICEWWTYRRNGPDGSFVPADAASIGLVDRIFTR